MEKRDKFRFTVRFDEMDQRHKMVAEILDKLGRKKARYLVEAVCFYEAHSGAGEYTLPAPEKRQKSKTVSRIKEAVPVVEEANAVGNERQRLLEHYDKADIATMKNGMNAFRRKKG